MVSRPRFVEQPSRRLRTLRKALRSAERRISRGSLIRLSDPSVSWNTASAWRRTWVICVEKPSPRSNRCIHRQGSWPEDCTKRCFAEPDV